MKSLCEFTYPQDKVGCLVVLDKNNDESTVYVLWKIDNGIASLVELDRPNEGFQIVSINSVYLLSPTDIVERVQEWK